MFKKILNYLFPNRKDKDYFVLGHMVKYNVYLVAKSIIFASFVNKFSGNSVTQEDLAKFAEDTEAALKELDLANKSN
ncbi:MAG: hypothetical protein ACK5GV_08645 [Bacteroidota bacterium]|jgi:hypothetical protein